MIEKAKEEHPFWGYRRVWAHLTYIKKLQVNKKRIYRLMKTHQLTVSKNTKLRAKRTPTRSKPKATKPNQLWGIDTTKFKTQEGWGYLVIVLDWYSKKIVGHHLNHLSQTKHRLQALEQGLQTQLPQGARNQRLKLVSDNGCQPTSKTFMKTCSHLEVEQVFTSYNNPEELLWLREWESIKQAEEALSTWIKNYNESYLHSVHGYRSPDWAEKNYREQTAA